MPELQQAQPLGLGVLSLTFSRRWCRIPTRLSSCYEGRVTTVTLGNPLAFNAFFTASSSNWWSRLTLNFSSRVGKSIWMDSCSTHGRVPSASRTRVGQPTAQVMPGTRRTTWNKSPLTSSFIWSGEGFGDDGALALSVRLQPSKPVASVTNVRTDRKSLRMIEISKHARSRTQPQTPERARR